MALILTAATPNLSEAMDAVVERSKALVGGTANLDRRVAEAFADKSLDGLRAVYAELGEASDAAEKLLAGGGHGTGCDAAMTTLRIVVAFAVNKLDGEGRYQDWMEDESLQLLEQYRGFLADCGRDAGVATKSRLTADHVKAL